MKTIDRIWNGVKLLLSAFLVLVSAYIIVYAALIGKLFDPALFGVVGFLFFLAALPWVSMERLSRAFALVVVGMGILFFYIAYDTFVDGEYFPMDCSADHHTGKSQIACYAMNGIYDFGGIRAVGSVWLLAGVLTLSLAVAMFVRLRKTAEQDAHDRRAEDRSRLS